MKCIAIDDEPLALEVVSSLCKNVDNIELVETFTQLSKARTYLAKHPVDLIFLDIQMPNQNGIDFYKSLKQDTMVIFVTAFSEFAVEGFELNAIDYILKPIQQDRFNTACDKAKIFSEYLKGTNQTDLYVRSEYSLTRISLEEIEFVETMGDYLKINLSNGKIIMTLMSLKSLLEELPDDNFIRVHRSYLVNTSKIISSRNKTIELKNKTVPIGSSYQKEIVKKLSS